MSEGFAAERPVEGTQRRPDDTSGFAAVRKSYTQALRDLRLKLTRSSPDEKLKVYKARDWRSPAHDQTVSAVFAFPVLAEERKAHEVTGPPARSIKHSVSLITLSEWHAVKASIGLGLTPHIAVAQFAGITHSIHGRTMQLGKDPDGPAYAVKYHDDIEEAVATARGEAEAIVFVEEPLQWLTRGPAGRTTADKPGWTDERTVKHTDGSGAGPVHIKLEFTQRGIERVEQPVAQVAARLLTEGAGPDDDDEDEEDAGDGE